MGTTASGLHYPDPDDPVDPPNDIKDLAEDIEPYIRRPLWMGYKSATTQSVASEVAEDVLWNARRIDTADMHSTSVNPERITPNRPGYYRVDAVIWWKADADNEAGERRVTIRKNGVNLFPAGRIIVGSSDQYSPSVYTFTIVEMNGTTDYFTIRAYQDTGNEKFLWGEDEGGSFCTAASVEYVRPLLA